MTNALTKRQQHFTKLLGGDTFRGALHSLISQNLTEDRFMEIVGSAINANTRLSECTPVSLMQSVLAFARVGLEPTGLHGGGWLIPYKGVATVRFSYYGMLKRVRRAAAMAGTNIDREVCEPVHEGDQFVYSPTDLERPIIHNPKLNNNGSVIAVYSIIRFANGELYWRVLDLDDIERAKKSSQSFQKGDGPWFEHTEEMLRKTALHRNTKRMPLDDAVMPEAHDLQTEVNAALNVVDVQATTVEEPETASKQMEAQLSGGDDVLNTPTAPGPTHADPPDVKEGKDTTSVSQLLSLAVEYGLDEQAVHDEARMLYDKQLGALTDAELQKMGEALRANSNA